MKTLITYFSAQGTTRKIAEAVAAECGVDTFEIVPEVQPHRLHFYYTKCISIKRQSARLW